jgi:hypothetical protein
MRRTGTAVLAVCLAAAPASGRQERTAPVPIDQSASAPAADPASPLARVAASTLAFGEMYAATPSGLVPTEKLRGLDGRRVRMVGFMAFQEDAPDGAFYLCPHPVYNDEGGNGDADIPPTAVLVVVRSAAGRQLELIPRPLEVTGTLEVGRATDVRGRVSFVRLVLDRPEDLTDAAARGRAN